MALKLIKSDKNKPTKDSATDVFLEHLDELRTRLIRSMAFVLIAAFVCWFVSGYMYRFLEAPVNRALAEAQQKRRVPIAGLNGQVSAVPLNSLHPGDKVRYAFPELTTLGSISIPAGTSVMARIDKDAQGNLGLYTDEPLSAGSDVLPKDLKLPIDLNASYSRASE
jgi:hypothetical protein